MSLGPASLFPLLKGWEYKNHIMNRTVTKGQMIDYRISELGWLVQLSCIANDSQLTFEMDIQGADLNLETLSINADSALSFGSLLPDPSGFLERYYKPNPASTLGIYVISLLTAGFYGSLMPFIPSLRLAMTLEPASTQPQAIGTIAALIVAITNKEKWIRSLRSVMGSTNIQIDPALLNMSPEGFETSGGGGSPVE